MKNDINIKEQLRAVPIKRLGFMPSLFILWRVLTTRSTSRQGAVNSWAWIMAAAIIVTTGLTSSAYAQTNLKYGDSLYAFKLFGERLVAVGSLGHEAKARFYQKLSDRRNYEASLFIKDEPRTVFIPVAYASVQAFSAAGADYVFVSDNSRLAFLHTLASSRFWTKRALLAAERIDDPIALDKVLEYIDDRQQDQVSRLNTIIDSLGLDIDKIEVNEVLSTLADIQAQQEAINKVRQEIKTTVNNQPIDYSRIATSDDSISNIEKLTHQKADLELTVSGLESGNLSAELREKISQRITRQQEKLDEAINRLQKSSAEVARSQIATNEAANVEVSSSTNAAESEDDFTDWLDQLERQTAGLKNYSLSKVQVPLLRDDDDYKNWPFDNNDDHPVLDPEVRTRGEGDRSLDENKVRPTTTAGLSGLTEVEASVFYDQTLVKIQYNDKQYTLTTSLTERADLINLVAKRFQVSPAQVESVLDLETKIEAKKVENPASVRDDEDNHSDDNDLQEEKEGD